MQTEIKTEKRQPVHKDYLPGTGLSYAVFEEDKISKRTGEKYRARRFTIQRSYKDREGVWVNENINLDPRELPNMLLICWMAFQYDKMNLPRTEEQKRDYQKKKDVEAFI